MENISIEITNLIFDIKKKSEKKQILKEWFRLIHQVLGMAGNQKNVEILRKIYSMYHLGDIGKTAITKIFIVTPTFNSEKTIAQTLDSVLNILHDECMIFYHIQDGGSSDNTLKIVKEWIEKLACQNINGISVKVLSQKDNGMYDAIAYGFSSFDEIISDNDWMLWINSDDQLDKIISKLIRYIDKNGKEIDFVTGQPSVIKIHGGKKEVLFSEAKFNEKLIAAGCCDGTLWRTIQQEGTFWRYLVWKKINIVDFGRFKYAGDYYLWFNLSKNTKIYQADFPTGYFNRRANQLSQTHKMSYFDEVDSILEKKQRLSNFMKLGRLTSTVIKVNAGSFSLSSVDLETEKHIPFEMNIIKILEEINIKPVIEPIRSWCKDASLERKEKELKRRLSSYTKIKKIFFDKSEAYDFLCIKSLHRIDYDLLFDDVLGTFPTNSKVITFNIKCEIDDQFENDEFLQIYSNCIFLMRELDLDSELDKSLAYLDLCLFIYYLKSVSEISVRNVVFFADMQPAENLICQYFNKIGVNTITLQHGLYVNYERFPNINRVNYLNQCAKYFLSWGVDTKNLINKFQPATKVVICGKPTLQPRKRFISSQRYVTVVLDQKIFHNENVEMLRIVDSFCKKNDYFINVRFHPQLNKNDYNSLGFIWRSDKEIEGSSFVVGHTSSLLFEMLVLDIPVFRYFTDKPSLPYPEELCFKNALELNNKFDQEYDFVKISKNYISFVGGESSNRYKNFFEDVSLVKNGVTKVSIVTVVFNDRSGLCRTIESIKSLCYKNFEYIVVDGASTDGTVDVIKQNLSLIKMYVSEPDRGIYNAMNKGIDLSTGEFVIFMNAGDEFSDKNVLGRIFESDRIDYKNIDVIYGDRNYIDLAGKFNFQKAKHISSINERMPFGHQSSFVKRSVLLENKFNETYRNAADYNQLVIIYKKGGKFLHVPVTVCNFYAGGASENGLLPYLEVLKIQIDNFGNEAMLNKSHYLKAFKKNLNILLDKNF